MVVEFNTGLSALKSAYDLAKSIIGINNEVDRNLAVIDVQRQLLEVQDFYSALSRRKDELEEEIMRMKNWESEKQRYQLKELPPGIFAYITKPGMEGSEPAHHICANCYNKNIKSLLHRLGSGNGLTRWKCYDCGFDEHSGTYVEPPRRDNDLGWVV